MSNVTHVNTVQIETGNNAVAYTSGNISGLVDGQFGLFKKTSMLAVDAAGAAALSANEEVFIGIGVGGGEFQLAGPIKGRNAKTFAGSSFDAGLQQAVYVGRSGAAATTIAIPVENSTEYQLTVLIKDDQRPHGQKQTREVFSYTTSNAATQLEAVTAIASLFYMRKQNGSFKQYNDRFVGLQIVSDGTGTTAVMDNGFNAVNGSKQLIFATDLDYGVGAGTVVPGDYLELAYVDANGTAIVASYLVAGVDVANLTITLDIPFQGTTGAFANTTAERLSDVNAAAIDYSFYIVAENPSDDWNGIDTYEHVLFAASYFASDDAGIIGEQANIYEQSAAVPATGSGFQVHDLEYFAQGFQGVNSRTRWFDSHINPSFRSSVSVGYDILTIGFETEYRTDFQNTAKAPKAATLCFLEADTDQSTSFLAVLNGYFSTVVGFDVVAF
jgi:hypothetical protein